MSEATHTTDDARTKGPATAAGPAASPSPSAAPMKAKRDARKRTGKRKPGRGAERGVALLMVLTSVALLYILAQQARDEVEVYSRAAAVSRDQVIAHYQATSSINLARVVLHSEPAIRRAITPILGPLLMLSGRGMDVPQLPLWEQADILIGPFRGGAAGGDLANAAGVNFGDGKNLGALTGVEPVRIIDEDSKININGFDRGPHIARRVGQQLYGLVANPGLDPFFNSRDPDGQFTDRQTLVAAMIDYADADQDGFDAQSLGSTSVAGTGGGAPEDGFYQLLRSPYQRRNAPFDSLEELRLVRGLGDDDLWQSIIDPDPSAPHRRTVTVWGQGLVNVNTANGQTILALLCAFSPAAQQCTDVMAASRFITGITMIQGFTLSMGIPLFSSPQQFVETVQGRGQMGQMLGALGIQPFVIAGNQLQQSVTTESKVFSLYASARIGSAHVRIHAVVDMRAQPPIPGTFLRASMGRLGASESQVVATQSGVAFASSQGGTIIHWRED